MQTSSFSQTRMRAGSLPNATFTVLATTISFQAATMTWTIERVTNENPLRWSIAEGVFDEAVRLDYVHDFVSTPNTFFLVAVADNQVVGMITGIHYAHPDKPRQLFIIEVGVDDTWQRRGIGTDLMRRINELALEAGCVESWVATEEDNHGARSLYERTRGSCADDRFVVYGYELGSTSRQDADNGETACQ
ncbi:MAG: GNAT family N-acetyltransferase [Candidatus Kapabacteria bacterium]|nr:GNAT family N-acetyltransferase [Candidatus Kapabacteria bacterium]